MATELLFEESIIYVHADLDPWAALSVGFNDDKKFVVALLFDRADDYCNHYAVKWEKQLVVDQKGMDRLVDRMHVPLTKLPKAFSKEFGYEGESWDVSEVLEIFDAIRNYLDNLNINYREKKIYRE